MESFRRVYITGFMGSGKTTAGKKLASALGYDFIDLDVEIEAAEGRSINEIFESSGEEYFRRIEANILRSIHLKGNSVISTGGGTPCFHSNGAYMRETGVVVYLKMTPQQIASRLKEGLSTRPLLKKLSPGELTDYVASKLSEREKYYDQATLVVDGMSLDIRHLTAKILDCFDNQHI